MAATASTSAGRVRQRRQSLDGQARGKEACSVLCCVGSGKLCVSLEGIGNYFPPFPPPRETTSPSWPIPTFYLIFAAPKCL